MDGRTLERLAYPVILEQLKGYTVSPLGRERVENLEPSIYLEEIKKWQLETTQGRDLLRLEPMAEVGGWYDIREQVKKSSRGIMLESSELLFVGRTLTAIRRVKKFLLGREENYPLLFALGLELRDFETLEERIFKAIREDGEILDSASSELGRIRRVLAQLQGQIKTKLNSYVRSTEFKKYLQDPIVTLRDNRYVIPVKQEYRSQVPGLIHDQSASGATLFIEPMAVVEANNEIRRLEVAHKQEIVKILSLLSGAVSAQKDELMFSQDALGKLDFIMAKARYSLKLNASQVEMTKDARLQLKRARHPLLTGDVVPIDIRLGDDFQTIIITGPNTGGKTVTLKTVGLLVLMAQSGLHIPADKGSLVGIFQNVFADIGDEQSIEQSLSTFSAHLTNIVKIMEEKTPDTLILLDELGAGTDPVEGSALAKAILKELHFSGAKTVATTHYGELKEFAYNTTGVENASVEFDVVSLRPTYKLLLGTPGRSNAFEIAHRLGLNEKIIEIAKEFLGKEQLEISDLMRQLEREKQESAKIREDAEALFNEAKILQNRYKEMEEKLKEKKIQILEKAREEARSLVRETKMESQEVISSLREKLKNDNARDREMGINEARQKMQKMQSKVVARLIKENKPVIKVDPNQLKVGQEIFIPQYGKKGFILELPSAGQVQVRIGVMKLNVPVSQIQLPPREEVYQEKGKAKLGSLVSSKTKEISTKLDMRGKTFAEAWPEIEKYLDDAVLAGLSIVCLVHGKGTGALRSSVQQALKNYPRVKNFRLGEVGEGGAGVTIVELK